MDGKSKNTTSNPPGALTFESVVDRVLQAGALLPAKTLWTVVGMARVNERFDDAEALLDLLGSRDGDSLKLADERARLAFARGDFENTLILLSDRYSRSPSATAAIAVARFHLETGNTQEAAKISSELAQTHAELVSVKQLSADVAHATGRIEDARSYFLGMVDDRPEHPPSLLALARLSIEEGDLASATAFYRRATAREDDPLTAAQSLVAAEVADLLGDASAADRHRRHAAESQAIRTSITLREIAESLDGTGSSSPVERRPTSSTTRITLVPAGKRRPREHVGALHATHGVTEPDDPRVLAVLKEQFGHSELRPGQAAVIAHELAGQDTLAIMPTGAGKSLTFQLPAMLDDQTTVVVSPLIALMKDQVDSLPASVRAKTALINSTLTPDEMRHRLDQLSRGELKLVYVAPERLRNYGFLRALRDAGVSRVVVDEAHCISMWGHDFRPDYLFIPRAVAELGQPPVLAITATATPDMVEQIAAGLDRKMEIVRTSVFRSNLTYEVHHLRTKEAKLERVIEICRKEQGDGIIYVSSRRDTESIAKMLMDRGVHAVPYHAGLDQAIRAANQDKFMSGQARVVVATVAFGMGVNKANVRFIVHVVAPGSLEAYAQESGRAGRDGDPARCILLVSPHDRTQLVMNARRDEMDLPALRRVYGQLMRQAKGSWVIADPSFLRAPAGEENDVDARVALGVLEQAELIRRHPDTPVNYELRRLPAVDQELEESLLPGWRRLEAHLPETWQIRGGCSVNTAEISSQSGLSPVEIDRIIQAHPAISSREGPRCMCLHLNPIVGDAAGTLQAILERSRRDAETRINLVMEYANGNQCRHVTLAAHLGERLDSCRTVCDICLGTADAVGVRGAAKSSKAGASAEAALAVLTAVKTLSFQMGKTGFTRLLLGSVESRVRADRSPSFGALSDVSKGKIESLIEQLIEDGWLSRDEEHEYRLLSITNKGKSATLEDLESFNPTRAASADIQLDSGEASLYERLAEWRRAKAVEEAVPPYVVAHNSMLKNLAVAKPMTKTALLSVPGFGASRVDKYGSEILSVISERKLH